MGWMGIGLQRERNTISWHRKPSARRKDVLTRPLEHIPGLKPSGCANVRQNDEMFSHYLAKRNQSCVAETLERSMPKKRKHLRGTVEKIIKFNHSPEKAQIAIHEAEDLYREIRVENELTDGNGAKASLKQGAEVDVIVEADSEATLMKPTTPDKPNIGKR